MELYLVRHTRPDVAEGLCYGRRDVALDEADLHACVPRIVELLPRGMAFYSSPAGRCVQLAERLSAATDGAAALHDARLHEMHFGDWEGRLWRELPKEETLRWTGDIIGQTPPGGENYMAMWERVAAAYDELVATALESGSERLCIVAHAGSLKVLLMRALKLAPAQFSAFDVAQGRVSRLDVTRDANGALFERLVYLNR